MKWPRELGKLLMQVFLPYWQVIRKILNVYLIVNLLYKQLLSDNILFAQSDYMQFGKREIASKRIELLSR